MQFKTLFVAALAGFVAAQDINTLISEIPSCALTCLLTGASDAGCGTSDYACQCSNQSTIQTSAEPCLTKACSTSDIASTYQPC